MNENVSWRRDGGIAVITVDNPPVNALKHAVRAGIRDCFAAARDDAAVDAIVLTGAGRTFMAGADITEFGKTSQPPSLIDVIREMDEIKKPTIAAGHGTPRGGLGFLTLACHPRRRRARHAARPAGNQARTASRSRGHPAIAALSSASG